MTLKTTVLFGTPQKEIARHIRDQIGQSISTSIVTGFATGGGIESIATPIKTDPSKLSVMVLGGATYAGFKAFDRLLAMGVPHERLYVHLGNTRDSSSKKNPFVRFHPMLHSKVYYCEMPDGRASAFVGSHNATDFALNGHNGELSVLLEGSKDEPEFRVIRQHIDASREQAALYTPDMKEAFAWWIREFIERAEIKIPTDWEAERTIVIFAQSAKALTPRPRETLYFEIPTGIQQIENLKTEAHLFLYETLPADPLTAFQDLSAASSSYTCITRGVDNMQGNLQLTADWQIVDAGSPRLEPIPGGKLTTSTSPGMQQVRAEIKAQGVQPYEYSFTRQSDGWVPQYADSDGPARTDTLFGVEESAAGWSRDTTTEGWRSVKGLVPRAGTDPSDSSALSLADPKSGVFLVVALRRRKRDLFSERYWEV